MAAKRRTGEPWPSAPCETAATTAPAKPRRSELPAGCDLGLLLPRHLDIRQLLGLRHCAPHLPSTLAYLRACRRTPELRDNFRAVVAEPDPIRAASLFSRPVRSLGDWCRVGSNGRCCFPRPTCGSCSGRRGCSSRARRIRRRGGGRREGERHVLAVREVVGPRGRLRIEVAVAPGHRHQIVGARLRPALAEHGVARGQAPQGLLQAHLEGLRVMAAIHVHSEDVDNIAWNSNWGRWRCQRA